MKFKFRIIKIFSLMLVVSLFFTINVSAHSSNSYDTYKKYAQNFMNKYNSNCKLKDPIELYSFQNKVQALLFQSNSNNGYIVVNLDDYSIPEFSPKDNNKFVLNDNGQYFYNGPLNYFKRKNGVVVDCVNKKKIDKLENLKTITPIKSNNTNLKFNLASNNLTYTLKNTLPNYSWNRDGRCVAVATGMLLSYYAQYWYNCSDYVDKDTLKYATTNKNYEKAFTDKLIYYITGLYNIPKDKNGNYEGIDPKLVPDGVNNYLVNGRHANYIIHLTYIKGFNNNFHQYESNVISALQNDKPVMLGISGFNEAYGCHEVTAWGYSTNGNNKFFMINDGWGNNFTYISPDYIMNIIY